jgi:hypothetical protein
MHQALNKYILHFTNKWNTVIIVSDGTRVLGLGDIGPKAGLPVMEGKALLYKYLGGVDGMPLMLDTKDPDKIIETEDGKKKKAEYFYGYKDQVSLNAESELITSIVPGWANDYDGHKLVSLVEKDLALARAPGT